jgi:D-amino peptidase
MPNHIGESMSNRRSLLLVASLVLASALVAAIAPSRGHATIRRSQRAAGGSGAPVRVLVYHDMEGLAGQDDWKTYLFSHPEKYPEGQKMLVADLNAVIDGLIAGGATQVDVVDAHGSGNPEPDVRRDLLDQRAKQVFREKAFDPYVDLTAPGTYDAVVAVAMHAKTGSRGFASHTITLGMDVLLNGKSITESEIVAYSWGRVGVPLIFVSGDDRLQNDLKDMAWLEFVVTKKATSSSTVELRPVDQVHAEMRDKAAKAVRNLSKAKVMTVSAPMQAGLHAVPPASLQSLEGIPGIAYANETVTFTAPDFRAAYDGVLALVRAARAGYSQVLVESVRRLPDGKQVMAAYSDSLFMRWMDYESGRWKPPVASAPAGNKTFHGDR